MNILYRWKKGIALLMASTMVCSDVAWARDSHFQPAFDGQASEGISWFHRQVVSDVPQLDETNLAKLSKYGLMPTVQDLYDYYLRSQKYFKAEQERLGIEEFNDQLNKNLLRYKESGYERIELTTIDEQLVARTVHGPSGVSVVFAEKDSIDPESKHLKQFISRQNFDSGRNRENAKYIGTDGKKRKVRGGRDSILVWVDHDAGVTTENIELHKRPKPFSGTWWKKWWSATYKKPTKENVIAGVTFGVFQAATGYLISALVIGSNPTPEALDMMHIAGGLNFAFGATIGTFASFYHNWRRRGSAFVQALKSSTISIAFIISLKMLGPDGFSTLNIFDPSLGVVPWIQLGNMIQNMAANNLHKTAWYQWADVRSEARVDTDNVKINIPYGLGRRDDGTFGVLRHQWETPIKQSDMNRQVHAYMPVNTLRLMDLMISSIYLTAASQDWAVPLISMAMLWALVPVSFWANHYMASKKFPEAAKTIGTEKAWHDIRNKIIPDWLLNNPFNKLQKSSASCEWLIVAPEAVPDDIQ